MTGQRTYWHLVDLPDPPGEYDIATSRLLYYPDRGFEVQVPLDAWYARHQRGSPLCASDWDRFRDPRATTYTTYTALQQAQEAFVDGILEAADDVALSPRWLAQLARVLGPVRYPVHGLHMVAAYVGSMAPSGRIVIAAAFQAADEVRRVQRLAYRTRQLERRHPGFAADGKERWLRDPSWQPLRELIERLLVTYDWGEALVALDLVVKPGFDELFGARLARRARAEGDGALAELLGSLDRDCAWHRQWARALVDMAIVDRADNAAVVQRWIDHWRPLVARALEALVPLVGEPG